MSNIVYLDECGCASIAGPAVVCGVVVKEGTKQVVEGIKDSKQLSKKKREELAPQITKSLEFELVQAPVGRIEEINIHWAKYEAMRQAVLNFIERGIKVDKVIVDGKFQIPDLDIPQEAIIKADDKLWQVGAASIIGKVHRDTLMAKLARFAEEYSYYDWENNAGYYSPKHRLGIILHGPTDLHRRKFVYFKYCMDRHREYKEFIKQGNDPKDFFKPHLGVDGKKISDFTLWKKAKKDFWQPVLPGMEKK